MSQIPESVRDFLVQRRSAVAGVSRDRNQPANLIYRRLRDTGHEVVAVNPAAAEVEGDRCWPDLTSVPGEVDAVVIATPPAAALCRERGIQVIVGGCPTMYCGRVDVAHRCMRWILDVRGRIEA